jgi:predicted aldo/keto reductase-like oxidoreductase
MRTIRLGRTGLSVSGTGFGALPVQRASLEEGARLLRRAFDAGINFFDTARVYTDSEEKIGRALSGVRSKLFIATKSGAGDKATILQHLETSLRQMQTEYVDILQLHNPRELPDPADPNSAYAALAEARRQGKARFVGITNHSLAVARQAAESGLYDTIQFPLSAISSAGEFRFVEECAARDIGVIAMKPLCGGLMTNPAPSFAALRQFGNLVPIWGIQRERELDEILALEAHPPALDAAMRAEIEKLRQELAGEFCRACGYCLPCPANIPIPMAARMGYLLRRMPWQQFLTPQWREKMARVDQCQSCGHCREHCPYELDPPRLLRKMFEDYKAFCAEKDG